MVTYQVHNPSGKVGVPDLKTGYGPHWPPEVRFSAACNCGGCEHRPIHPTSSAPLLTNTFKYTGNRRVQHTTGTLEPKSHIQVF